MAAVYIREQGVMVTKQGECIAVVKGAHRLMERPIIGIDALAVFGNVQISSQAIALLLEHGIDISFFTYSGKYLGHVSADTSKNIFLRMSQYDLYMENEKRMAMARIIVEAKIKNQLSIIKSRRWESDFDWRADVAEIEKNLKKLPEKKDGNGIRGIEGICSNIYFHSYAQMFSCDFKFEKRSRRPPRNPINVILSLAYTLLTKEVINALEAESFETSLGFLHGIRYGRKSLALDMVEEFRQPAADRLVLKVFNKRMLTECDFDVPEEGVVNLTEEGFKRFCTAYERWMNGMDTNSGEKSFRSRIREQGAKLKRTIMDGTAYEPYIWKKEDVRGEL